MYNHVLDVSDAFDARANMLKYFLKIIIRDGFKKEQWIQLRGKEG